MHRPGVESPSVSVVEDRPSMLSFPVHLGLRRELR